MDLVKMRALVEALIFASPEPLDQDELASSLGLDSSVLSAIVREIEDSLSLAESGIALSRAAGGLSLVTKPELSDHISTILASIKHSPLTDASLETLAIIAYRQPITKAEIEQVRGVGAESALITLAQRGLISEKGRKNAPGRPILYGTTKEFLIYLGIRDLSALPGLPSIPSDEIGQKLPGLD